ncbi:hypothetical protein F4V90_31255, partial [Neorhizobium galegae]
KRYLRLESRAVVPARSSRHGLSCSRHLSRSQAEIPLVLAAQISRASSIDTSLRYNQLCLRAAGAQRFAHQ